VAVDVMEVGPDGRVVSGWAELGEGLGLPAFLADGRLAVGRVPAGSLDGFLVRSDGLAIVDPATGDRQDRHDGLAVTSLDSTVDGTWQVAATADGRVITFSGEDLDDRAMWERALASARGAVEQAPEDPFAWFNLGTVYTRLGETELAVGAFDEARRIGLPLRMLWYQFEPFEAYLDAGRYDDVVQLGYATAYSASGHEEAYFYEGLGYLGKGMEDMAVSRWQQALEYNPNFEPATGALEALAAGS